MPFEFSFSGIGLCFTSLFFTTLGAIMSGHKGQSSHGQPKQPIDLDQIWSDLLQGIEQVYNKQAMSKLRYMDLYT